MFMRLAKRSLLVVGFILLFCVTAVVGITIWEMPPKSERQLMSLRWEWDQANRMPVSKQERTEKDLGFFKRCVQLADQYPDTATELASLMLADHRCRDLPERQLIEGRLRDCIENAKFNQLLRASGYGMQMSMSNDVAAPAVFAALRKFLDHPKAPYVLAQTAWAVGSGSESADSPQLFGEIAELLVERFSASPEIASFCSSLGNGTYSPPWAHHFESHLHQILDASQDRFVRLSATMALAEIAHNCEARQDEAEQRYLSLLKNFDGRAVYSAQGIELMYREDAKNRLESMQYAPIGRSVPTLVGLDLEGVPLDLREYRGKVVVLSFWATWCGPCMKLIPHEVELLEQYAGQPLVIIGVNADDDPAVAMDATKKKSVTWRSFRDRREDGMTISKQWHALFPTVYIIDHLGIVRHRFSGNPTTQALKQCIAPLVSAAGPSR